MKSMDEFYQWGTKLQRGGVIFSVTGRLVLKIEVLKGGVITRHELCSRYTLPPYEIAPPYYYGSVKDSCICGEDDCEWKRED